MEYRFNLNEFLTDEVSKIDKDLLPETFDGDRRAAAKCITHVSEILDTLGIASARAHELMKPITSAEKLRNSDYIVYILADLKSNNGNGTVVGFLKVGRKNLYMYDATGVNHEKKAVCVMDFYVYEHDQREGYGKWLFDHMLHGENVLPQEIALDKPSEKLLAFLFKSYGLQTIIPQANNFVIYEGFFDYLKSDVANGTIEAPCKPVENDKNESEAQHSFVNQQDSIMPDENGLSMYGRDAARKPISTIGEVMSTNLQQDILPSDYTPNEACDTFPHKTQQCDVDNARYDLKYNHSSLW